MGAFFRIRFTDGSEGYQVNDGGYVTDVAGTVLTGNLEYTTVDANAATPSWYVAPSPPVEVPSAPVEDRHITKYAFRQRFTMTERATVEFAAVDKETDNIATRQTSAGLRSQLRDLDLVAFVNLDDPVLSAGLGALETYGLLALGRAAEIINAPVMATERLQ